LLGKLKYTRRELLLVGTKILSSGRRFPIHFPLNVPPQASGHGELSVEMGVLNESKTLFILEMAKVPKDVWQVGYIGFARECLWYRSQI